MGVFPPGWLARVAVLALAFAAGAARAQIEFAGATPAPTGGYGDAATNHFWSDSIANLLRTHRIV